MNLQLNHKYLLTIGKPYSFYGTGESITLPNYVVKPPEILTTSNVADLVSLQKNGLELTQHHIEFNINVSKNGNKQSTITIFNAGAEVLQTLSGKPNSSISLHAGWESDTGDIPLIFQGEVFKVSSSFNGTTTKTEILMTSGNTNMKEAYTSKSFPAGTKVSDIVDSVIKDLKLPTGSILISRDKDIVIQKPMVVNGKTYDFLSKLMQDLDSSIYIENSVVKVLPKNYVERDGRWIFDISAELGNLIGSPSVSTNNEPAQQTQFAARSGINVETTLNGAYVLGGLVNLTSRYHNGVYEIESIMHSGSYEGDQWKSTLGLKPVNDWRVA